MKRYLPKVEQLPLGIDAEMILGLSGILETKINQYLREFPRAIRLKSASINRGAMSFEIIKRKRRKRK
jgi:hypothetical protein